MNDLSSPIDSVIKRYERRLAAFRVVRELLADDRGFARDLAELLALRSATEPQQAARGNGQESRTGTHFDVVEHLFEQNGNAWLETPEIVKRSGLARGSVGALLHQTRKKAFEKRDTPGNNKTKQWRLRKGGDK